MRGAGSIATAAGSDRVGDLKLFEATAILWSRYVTASRRQMAGCQITQHGGCPLPLDLSHDQAADLGWLSFSGKDVP